MSAPTGNGADGASERAHVKPCCSPRLALQIRSFAVFMSRSTNAFYPFLSAAGTPTSWTTTETFRIPLLAVCSSTSGRLPLPFCDVCLSVCMLASACMIACHHPQCWRHCHAWRYSLRVFLFKKKHVPLVAAGTFCNWMGRLTTRRCSRCQSPSPAAPAMSETRPRAALAPLFARAFLF